MDKKRKKITEADMMLVSKDWGIRADSICITLYNKHKSKAGVFTWVPYGYYYDFNQAAIALANKAIQTCKSFQEMITRLNELEESLTNPSDIAGKGHKK